MECRGLGAPAAARARAEVKEHQRVSQGHTEESPSIPRAMVYGLFRALPGDRALLPPSPLRSLLLRNLTPASGRQDHTTSPSASGALVSSTIRQRPPHPASTFVTIMKRPSCEAGRRQGFTDVSIGGRNELFFQEGLDDANQLEFVRQIKFCVKSNFRSAAGMCIAIAAHDLPVGQISGATGPWCRAWKANTVG